VRKPAEIEQAFSPRSALDGKSRFFLVGIGGAGMSALARMLHSRGFSVRGSDGSGGLEVDRLNAEGIRAEVGHSGEWLEPDEALVVSDAIDLATSPEVHKARELSLPIVRRSQALGWVLKPYRVVAVTGTHGKTTTTGMTGSALIAAGVDPVVVVGASIPQWSGPVREGAGEWAVVEACEAYDSFHDVDPEVVVLTNLELDHVDFHGTWENLRASVLRFVNRAQSLIYCGSDAGACEIATMATVPTTAYDAGALEGEVPRQAGAHNVLNASAAVTVAKVLGVDTTLARKGALGFAGAERRLQTLYAGDVHVVDDYAHHPTEIRASLEALRTGSGRLVVVYQPHLYSRTASLIPEFAEALDLADFVVLTDIYPAREDPIPGVSSARIVELLTKPSLYVPSRHLLPRAVAKIAKPGDTVVGMGAGNIQDFAPRFVQEWQRQRSGRAVRVSVVYGGDSAEREVSLLSGRAVHAALRDRGYDAYLVDVTEKLLSRGDLSEFVGDRRPDVVFLAVHGTNSEDGGVQGLLELLHLPYTGSGVQASAICMDKEATKRVLTAHGVRVPKGVYLARREDAERVIHDLFGAGDVRLVVKPNAQGSTVGLSFVATRTELGAALDRAFSFEGGVLVEEWLSGMEISTPVLCDQALPPVEIVPNSGQYDFAAKYTPGATTEICPARLPEDVLSRAREIARQAHHALRCEGATRTDAIVTDAGEVVVLEVNTLPGMTGTSLLPNSAQAAGISFGELCERLVQDALERDAAKT
jgi:D-alanine--D-alanine ligase